MNGSQTTSFTSRLFPVPKYLTLDPVSLELSANVVRLFTLKKSPVGLVPDVYKEVKLKKTCEFLQASDDMSTCGELKQVLQDLKKEFKFTYVSVSLSETKTYIFKTTVPKTAMNNMRETLSFKIEENVPLDPSEVMFDYKVLKSAHASDHVDVVVSALPRTVIEAYTSLLESVGLIPVSFRPESTAASKAVIGEDDPHPYLLINLAEEKVGLAIVEQHAVHYTSSFPIQSQAIVSDFKGSSANGFKEQINKLLVYWFTNQHDPDDREKIQTVILVGEYAVAPGLTPFLENKLKINVEIGNVWKNCFDINNHIPGISKKESLSFATAIGLALD